MNTFEFETGFSYDLPSCDQNKCYHANFIIFGDVGYGGIELELDQACMNQEILDLCLFV